MKELTGKIRNTESLLPKKLTEIKEIAEEFNKFSEKI